MARQRRLNEAGTHHHITARGVDRCPIFSDDHDRRQFLALLSEARRRFGCRIIAFCLMTNHLHLTVRDDEGTLSKTLHYLNGVYAKRFNLRHDRTGHLFERRFWSSMLDSDAYLAVCAVYVHRNPVEAGIVGKPQDYRWSSYQSYLGMRPVPDFLDIDLLLGHYGDDTERLRVHTEQPLGNGAIPTMLRATNPPPLLSEASSSVNVRPVPVYRERGYEVAMEEVVAVCAAVTGRPPEELTVPTPGRRSEARGLAAFVAHRHAGVALESIAMTLGLGSAAAASMLHRRFASTLDCEARQGLVGEALRLLDLDQTC